MAIFGIAFLILLGLKAAGLNDYSWWVVLLPLVIELVIDGLGIWWMARVGRPTTRSARAVVDRVEIEMRLHDDQPGWVEDDFFRRHRPY